MREPPLGVSSAVCDAIVTVGLLPAFELSFPVCCGNVVECIDSSIETPVRLTLPTARCVDTVLPPGTSVVYVELGRPSSPPEVDFVVSLTVAADDKEELADSSDEWLTDAAWNELLPVLEYNVPFNSALLAEVRSTVGINVVVTSCDDKDAFDDSGDEAFAVAALNKLLPVEVELSVDGIDVTDGNPIV